MGHTEQPLPIPTAVIVQISHDHRRRLTVASDASVMTVIEAKAFCLLVVGSRDIFLLHACKLWSAGRRERRRHPLHDIDIRAT
jgi:hypothetical protein